MSETGSAGAEPLDYDIVKILKALPHRYPLLLVDRVKAITLGERIHAVKAVSRGKRVIFMGIENAKFRAPVTPGCLLDLHVEFTQKRSRVYKFKGVASVEGKTTCEVEFTAMMTDRL